MKSKKKNAFNHSPTVTPTQDARTTVMIQGVPRSYMERDLLHILAGLIGPASFDFFYMPWNFQRNTNNGCAFVNFTSPENAQKCMAVLDGCTFQCDSKIVKPCTVVPANLQGLVANMEYYSTRLVRSSNQVHAPMVFQNGVCLNFQNVIADFCQNNSGKGNALAEPKKEFISDISGTPCGRAALLAEDKKRGYIPEDFEEFRDALTDTFEEFSGSRSPPISLMDYSQKLRDSQEVPSLFASKLSLGASFDNDFSVMTEHSYSSSPQMDFTDSDWRKKNEADWRHHSSSPQMDLTDFGRLGDARNTIQPADTKGTMLEPSFTDEPFPESQMVQETAELAKMRGETIRALQQSLDCFLSQQSCLYAQQKLKQQSPKYHHPVDVWETATTSAGIKKNTSHDTLYTVTTASPRESMQTLSEPDDDIRRDVVSPYLDLDNYFNRMITPPPGLENQF
jgi:hypothetical protein